MNDPRIDAFLHSLRQDLGEFFASAAAEERTREIALHLEQAVAEHRDAGYSDPVAAALLEFGDAKGYRAAAEKRLARLPERTVVRLAALGLLVPIALDLAMDASSWLTGSDSSLWAISVPITLLIAARFVLASTKSRRFLFVPLTGLTLACFAAYLILGGWTRATGSSGGYGAQTRGTAYRRRQGLIRDLPEKQARLATLERAVRIFREPRPTKGVGEFRAASGYLTPTIPEGERRIWQGDPGASRWLLDMMRYVPVEDYAAASPAWKAACPELLRFAQASIDGDRREIDELASVVACPWSVSVAAQFEPKATMTLVALADVLLLHGIGVLAGWIVRRPRKGLA